LIIGTVTELRVPIVELTVAGQSWEAIVDSGFNGDLELPIELKSALNCRFIGPQISILAGDQRIEEDAYEVEITFDDKLMRAEATFVVGRQILIGTRILRSHRLEIDFPARSVRLTRV
jgi:predicted aspartyl protease